MPCPCHAHAMPMPCPCHALTMPFFWRPRHITPVERRPAGYLPPFSFFQLPSGVPLRLLSEAYQSSSQRSIPMTVKSGSSTLQKSRPVNLLDYQFGYFRLPHGLSRRTLHRRSRAGARYGTCELTARHGHRMNTVWARHAMCQSALRVKPSNWIKYTTKCSEKYPKTRSEEVCVTDCVLYATHSVVLNLSLCIINHRVTNISGREGVFLNLVPFWMRGHLGAQVILQSSWNMMA